MIWTNGWAELGRIAGTAVVAYAILVLLLRLSGKRTLSKLNAFDFVVTIALGSTLATAMVSSQLSVTGGATALLVLVMLQFGVAWVTVRSKLVSRLVRSRATHLYREGALDENAMRQERVRREEIEESMRKSGVGSYDGVGAIVLETDGTISVITRSSMGDGSSLASVRNA